MGSMCMLMQHRLDEKVLALLLPMLFLRIFVARYCENKVLWSIVLNTCVLLPIRASPVVEHKTQLVTENARRHDEVCDSCSIILM